MKESYLKLVGYMFGLASAAFALIFMVPLVRNHPFGETFDEKSMTQFSIGFGFLLVGIIVVATTSIIAEKSKKK